MTSPNKIKSILNQQNGVAQPCHYVCTILPPIDIQNKNKGLSALLGFDALKNISLLAERAELPGRQFLTTEHKIYGTQRKMPYGLAYNSMNITFICTNYMAERTFFDIWHQYIIGPRSQYMEYYSDYVGQVIIQKRNNDIDGNYISSREEATQGLANKLSTYVLEEAYPVSIQPQELSYDGDGYLKLTVEFAYAKWTSSLDDLYTGESNVISPFNSPGESLTRPADTNGVVATGGKVGGKGASGKF